MKHFFLCLTLLSFSQAIAQEPLLYFDKTRCQQQPKISIDFDNSFPYFFDTKKFFPPNNPIFLWKKVEEQFIHQQIIYSQDNTLVIPTPGCYIIAVFDRVKAQLIEVFIRQKEVQITRYLNCVLHY